MLLSPVHLLWSATELFHKKTYNSRQCENGRRYFFVGGDGDDDDVVNFSGFTIYLHSSIESSHSQTLYYGGSGSAPSYYILPYVDVEV